VILRRRELIAEALGIVEADADVGRGLGVIADALVESA